MTTNDEGDDAATFLRAITSARKAVGCHHRVTIKGDGAKFTYGFFHDDESEPLAVLDYLAPHPELAAVGLAERLETAIKARHS